MPSEYRRTFRLHQLAEEFQINIRTIQRDLNERLDFLAWNEHGGRYYSLDKAKLGHLYPQDIERFARFCSIQDLLPEIDRTFYQEHLTQSIQIKGFQYEDIKNRQPEFDLIRQSIENRNTIEFHYRKAGHEKGKYYTLEPYSLLNRNGIWYVIGIDCEAGKQKTFCFTQMTSINRQPETFEPTSPMIRAANGEGIDKEYRNVGQFVADIFDFLQPIALRFLFHLFSS